jgi:beta-glucosidase
MSRIDTLLDAMTLPEKLGQLTMTASSYAVTGPIIAGDSTESIRNGTLGNLLNMVGSGPVHEMQKIAVEGSRLGIPLLIGLDVIHGHRTLFPIPLGEASLFDAAAWERTAHEAACETAADGLAMTFAPMVDVSRDPRWGRTAEGPGEDPWLARQIARAKVRGFQGSDLSSPQSVAACAKHFCAYGPVTAGREYASVDISERTLREVHLPAFEASVAAGVVSIMPAFTDLNGIPMTAHVPLLRDYLRNKLGFDGVIISDYNAIGELIKHGVAADPVEAAVLALKAGVDIDMMAEAYRNGLPVALERGLVTMAMIDASVRRVLQLKERLGLFEDPYRRGSKRESTETLATRRQLARDVGARSLVLLQNEANALPLSRTVRTITLLGPLADARAEMRGPWAAAGIPEDHVSVLDGLRAALPLMEIRHAAGVSLNGSDVSGIPAALQACEGSDAIVLCLGESANMSGEAASRACPELPGEQRALAMAVTEWARARSVPVTAILFSGRPLMVSWLAERAQAVLAAWFPGIEAGNAIADVITGHTSPSGRTPITWPRTLGQVPLFYAQHPGGRPFDENDFFTSKYLDVPNDPLYPFGHGLTYGRCRLANLRVSPESIVESGTIHVSVEVTNEGTRTADEVVFLFVRDKVASVARPVLELKGFQRITLASRQKGVVEMTLPATELRFLGQDLQPVFEPGEVAILVGPSADRSKLLSATIQLRG